MKDFLLEDNPLCAFHAMDFSVHRARIEERALLVSVKYLLINGKGEGNTTRSTTENLLMDSLLHQRSARDILRETELVSKYLCT